MTRRRERPMLSEEKDAIRALAKGGMRTGVIATALFISKRQVKYTIEHDDDDTEAVTLRRSHAPVHTCGHDSATTAPGKGDDE